MYMYMYGFKIVVIFVDHNAEGLHSLFSNLLDALSVSYMCSISHWLICHQGCNHLSQSGYNCMTTLAMNPD